MGPKAGNGGDLCLYLVQLRAGQPIGYGFNAAAVDKLRNRNIIGGQRAKRATRAGRL